MKAFVVPELNLGQMVHEVERAAAGKASGHPRDPRRRQRAQSRSDSESHCGGGPMNEQTLEIPIDIPVDAHNPVEPFLRMDRMPHIWCPGCGIGTTVNCFTRALLASKANLDKVAVVSGIGCTGRVAGYARLDSFHTTHGRAIPFATGLKLSNPELQVVVYSGDGDLFAIGGNHFIHAARRNMDIKVICVNNLTYAMTGGQTAPTTPGQVISATSPYGVFEPSFNLVALAEAAGAVVRRALDHVPRQAAQPLHGRGAEQEGLLLHRSPLALPDAVPAPQQDGRRPRRHEVLQGSEQGPQRRAHQRMRADQIGRDRGRQVRRSRPSRLSRTAPRANDGIARRSLRRAGGLMQLLTEIRIAGFGGQGVILAAAVIGKACAIFQGDYATMTQSFGPEARGGSSSAQVILSTEPILYPYVTQPDILVVMSQEAYTRLRAAVEARRHPDHRAGAGARRPACPPGVRAFGVPATRLAEELGRKVVLNIVMVGLLRARSPTCSTPMRCAKRWRTPCPPAMQKLNLQAFDKGYEYGSRLILEGGEPTPSRSNPSSANTVQLTTGLPKYRNLPFGPVSASATFRSCGLFRVADHSRFELVLAFRADCLPRRSSGEESQKRRHVAG